MEDIKTEQAKTKRAAEENKATETIQTAAAGEIKKETGGRAGANIETGAAAGDDMRADGAAEKAFAGCACKEESRAKMQKNGMASLEEMDKQTMTPAIDDAGDGAVSGNQARTSRVSAVLQNGRFL